MNPFNLGSSETILDQNGSVYFYMGNQNPEILKTNLNRFWTKQVLFLFVFIARFGLFMNQISWMWVIKFALFLSKNKYLKIYSNPKTNQILIFEPLWSRLFWTNFYWETKLKRLFWSAFYENIFLLGTRITFLALIKKKKKSFHIKKCPFWGKQKFY